ncbi:PTS galactosamine transporter subunit IIC [uncultured Traorella sp.]|uniref:PTS galactosamine transporter subunit IIC n=1 Tax=uncultured Traorella sp. TaxID=1929048 RepID=UPI0025FA6C09|nr:PTS galactosamine transporter subunit IIC [uncultured Traorella sp.]
MHEITLFQGILLAIMAFIVGMDFYLEVFFWFRPIICGTLTGLILGNLQLGLVCGGAAELAFAGLTPAGGTQPPNPILAGIMAPVLAYSTGVEATEALALALPFSFLMQYVVLMFWSGYSFLMPLMDKSLSELNFKKFNFLSIGSLILVGIVYAIIVFLCAYLAQDVMRNLVGMMPEWLSHGFEVLGGVLPAIGFAMLLKIMLKSWLIPYLIFGFIFATFLPFSNLLPLALTAVGMALIDYYRQDNTVVKGEIDDEEGI